MKIPKKSLIFLSFIIIAVLLAQIDDSLNSDANTMLDSIKWESPSNAYLYLLGLGADLKTDPVEEGKKVLSEIRQSETFYAEANNFAEIKTLNYKPPLELPNDDIFCSMQELSCIYKVFSDSKLDLNSETFEVLSNRYLTFLKMEQLHSLTMPHIYEYFPNYSYIITANRLVSLKAIDQARNCCPEDATDSLYDLIELQRRNIEQSDNLIGKLIGYALLNETIEVLSMLLREFNLAGKKIKPLAKKQLSFSKPINREFAFARTAITIAATGDKWTWIPKWVEKMLIKQNMTSNAVVPIYHRAVRLSESPQIEFTRLLGQSEKIVLEKAWIRNLLGTLLNESARPNFDQYVVRGFDMNAKISLFNEILGKAITPEMLGRTQNPYHDDSNLKAVINHKTNRVCFDGPLEDLKHVRCISLIKI